MSKNTSMLGKIEKMDTRAIWKDEAKNFTPWLAEEESISLLGKTIDLELEDIECEKEIGKYKADITARDLNEDRIIVIENQFGKTDHDHLGKIITYASGINAKVIIWLCESINEEHREAIDWLNEIGKKLDWLELPEGQDSRIILTKECSYKEIENWDEQFRWLRENGEAFHKAFYNRIQKLKL